MAVPLRRKVAPSASVAKTTEWISQVICCSYLMIFLVFDISYSLIWLLLVVGSAFLRLLFCGRVSSIRFSLYAALVYLYLGPTIGLFATESGDALPFLALFILSIDVLSHLSRTPFPSSDQRFENGSFDKLIWAFLILSASVGGVLLEGADSFASLFAFTIPFAVSLVFFERITRKSSLPGIIFMLAMYFVLIVIYISLYWSGFGRLVIGAYALMPILIADYHRDFGLRMWHVIALAPPLLAVSHLSRYGGWGGWADLSGGSSSHHLILTLQLGDSDIHRFYGGFGRFVEQYSLLFLNWVPRDLWPSKPVGLGLISVDEWIGRSGYGEGFSVSLGMFGEQLYLLGSSFFFFSWLAIIATILMLRKYISKLSLNYVAPIVAFDVSLISYVWGGSGTFGSRVWFFVTPMILVIFCLSTLRIFRTKDVLRS